MPTFPKYLIVSAKGRGFRSAPAGTPDEVKQGILDLSAQGTSPDNVAVYARSGAITLVTQVTWANGSENGATKKRPGRKKKGAGTPETATT